MSSNTLRRNTGVVYRVRSLSTQAIVGAKRKRGKSNLFLICRTALDLRCVDAFVTEFELNNEIELREVSVQERSEWYKYDMLCDVERKRYWDCTSWRSKSTLPMRRSWWLFWRLHMCWWGIDSRFERINDLILIRWYMNWKRQLLLFLRFSEQIFW